MRLALTVDDAYDYAADMALQLLTDFFHSLPPELKAYATLPEDAFEFVMRPDLWTDDSVSDLMFAYTGIEPRDAPVRREA